MPQWLLARHVIARRFALGIALTGLMLAFLAASSLVFPYKAAANPEVQGELLYDLLGHLNYDGNGRFGPIDDDLSMQRELYKLIAENHLNAPVASAYILNVNTGDVAWSAAANPQRYDSVKVAPGYDMQFITLSDRQLAAQNFWIRNQDGSRAEFRMLVVLPLR